MTLYTVVVVFEKNSCMLSELQLSVTLIEQSCK